MNNGAYDLEGVIYHQHSPKLMKAILEMWPDKSIPVIDLGCGLNYYVTVLLQAGYSAVGCDAVDLGNRYFFKVDLTKPDQFLLPNHKNVISLETGEHLPEEFLNVYLDHVASFGGDVLLSWAIPGQAGHGHISCRSNDWVVEQMGKRGYQIDGHKTVWLRNYVIGCHCNWFRNTLMYFIPKDESRP